jgi:predicted nucleic acid-binding protein
VTADKVVDASAIAAFIFNEPRAAAVEARLRDTTLHAPAFIDVEMASICLKKLREVIYPRDVVLGMYAAFSSVVIRRSDVALTEAIELAERTRLSLYDANYLWLARHLSLELVTLDERLERAAAAL